MTTLNRILIIEFFPGFEVPSSTGSSGGEPTNSSLKKGLGYGPDLTSEVRNSPSDCFEYQFSDRASNCDSQKGRSVHQPLLSLAQFSDFRPTSEHFYEQPMVVFPPSSNLSPMGKDNNLFVPTYYLRSCVLWYLGKHILSLMRKCLLNDSL